MKYIPIGKDKSSAVISEIILKLKVRDVMNTNIITATKHCSLRRIQRLMKVNRITGVPITQDHKIIGIISMDDIVEALDKGYIEELAETHMTTKLITLEDDMPLTMSISYFNKFKFGRFPVIDKEKNFVGLITQGDITSKLLEEVTNEIKELESKIEKNTPLKLEKQHKEYQLIPLDFEHAGVASNEIKKILKMTSLNSKILRRVAVAAYELEINIVVHSHGGQLIFETEGTLIRITAVDTGPGILDIEKALQEGFSTATEKIRAHGFGAGMGLNNVKRVSDKFEIQSDPSGTRVISEIYIDQQEASNENK